MDEFRLAASLREEGNVPGAVQHAARALELDPENAQALIILALIHADRGDAASAETEARRAVAILERRPDMASTLAEARNVLGGILLARGRPADAIPVLRASASDIHNHAPWFAWGNLGRAYFETRDYTQASEVLAQAVRLQPRFCVGHYWLGQVKFATEDFAAAEESLGRAIEADPRCAGWQEAYKLRGEVRARLDRRDDAIADFERCVELGPENEIGTSCRRFLEGN